jgi:nicotinate dehydrogenase subunit B
MKLTVNGSEHEGTVPLDTPLLYPILTTAEMPELKVVIADNTEASLYGQGSESANALAAPAIAAALFDATGKPARRIPLRPDYVKAMLAS